MEQTISMGTAMAITACGLLLGIVGPALSRIIGMKARAISNFTRLGSISAKTCEPFG